MELVIAEKPSVAQSIAAVLGATQRKDGYLEGNEYLVSWCVGHLVELAQPESYEEAWKKWSYESLPIIPQEWQHEVKSDTKAQYQILKKLMHDDRVDAVVCATDAGREGELIFRLTYNMAGCRKPMKRLWISSMEESAIRDGFHNLRPGSDYDNLYHSALCRQEADWLVGINGTRLFTVLYGGKALKVGRVQTPTLAMLVDRESKIMNFKKEAYYMAHIMGNGLDAVSEHISDEELMEKTEAVERERLSERIREEADSVVADFKAKTEELFNGINGQTQDDIEQTVWAYLQSKLDEYEIDVELVDVVVSGSRCRGLEKAGSDLDVVVEYKGREHEDDLFNVFNEDGLMIGGVKVDINPITEGKTGTLATYLPRVESYLAEKQAMQKASAVEAIPEKTITLTVAECGEFHSLGEFHENIASVEEAIAVWKSIPPERMNGIPSIGINIHTEGTERYEDVEMDILSGKVIDLEVLDYVPDITDEPKAIEVIAELIDKLPDIEVRGSLEKWQAAILASQIDQFSYDYDTYQYQDTVEDREAQVANITEDIRNGNTGYLNDFLNAVISEGVREGITDIFGEGVEIDDSEAVQTARRAKELLDKLAEYKPLAKVEELEEQNYNMIDNVLNNGAEKKEQEQIKGRISIKEKLAEKKAVIEQRDKAERTSPEKETEKKSQREM